GMPPVRIVPALDVAEAGHARLRLAVEPAPGQQLRLQGREEALAHRVVISIAYRPHRGPHARFPATAAEGERGILASLVRVVDPILRPSLPSRRFERTQPQLG